jgi:hypothetical protein
MYIIIALFESSEIPERLINNVSSSFQGGPCPTCEVVFKRWDHLQTHIRKKTCGNVHEKEEAKPFCCVNCNEKFSVIRDQADHNAFVHLNVCLYKCGCGEQFQKHDQMVYHDKLCPAEPEIFCKNHAEIAKRTL